MKKTTTRRTTPATRAPAPVSRSTKVFVLDTNVLIHDPTCIFRFEENDIVIPITVLQELDKHKKGNEQLARDARQVTRTLNDLIVKSVKGESENGINLASDTSKLSTGKLFFHTEKIDSHIPRGLDADKMDNRILAVISQLKEKYPGRSVILVSKDINMRVTAFALGIEAQDYSSDQVLEDTDLMYSGSILLPKDFWEKNGQGMKVEQRGGRSLYKLSGPDCRKLRVNQFVHHAGDSGENPLSAIVRVVHGNSAQIETLVDYSYVKNAIWGVNARNKEQNFALNLLMDPEIDFVTLLGQAGTGKTLLAIAAGLHHVLDTRVYSEIMMTRATVSVGDDIGFLPGTEEDKMWPWMGALEDNLEVLNKGSSTEGKASEEWGTAATNELIRSRIKIKSLNFMRGRTFLKKYVIIDEAQNLTPKQMKTLITRAGPGTKMVCLGNIAQIDTPYLTESSSGLTYAVDRFKGWPYGGHIILQRGERSRLADFASEAL